MNNHGFTLVELLIVIAILGVLATLMLPTFSGAQKRPYDLAAIQCGRAIVTFETTAPLTHGGYVSPLSSMGADVTEACTDVRVALNDTRASNPAATVAQAVSVSSSNYAFQVFHPRGSGYYLYNREGTDRLGTLIPW